MVILSLGINGNECWLLKLPLLFTLNPCSIQSGCMSTCKHFVYLQAAHTCFCILVLKAFFLLPWQMRCLYLQSKSSQCSKSLGIFCMWQLFWRKLCNLCKPWRHNKCTCQLACCKSCKNNTSLYYKSLVKASARKTTYPRCPFQSLARLSSFIGNPLTRHWTIDYYNNSNRIFSLQAARCPRLNSEH